ncbi:Altered inheritance of mitochondria protein 32 [Yarrowia sp. C11]|nr:Altered inheritance of mitochondria protein 32 [Yarrowia sp. E02]KAG5371732.1 Altered inheritance of mitochondria protein 32 [Yarrowia sp. C11]
MGLLDRLKTMSLENLVPEKPSAEAQIRKIVPIADCSPTDCDSCVLDTRYPSMDIDQSPLYNTAKPFGLHIVVATGLSDWKKKYLDDKTSVAGVLDDPEVAKAVATTMKTFDPTRPLSDLGTKISNSSLPPPDEYYMYDDKRPSSSESVSAMERGKGVIEESYGKSSDASNDLMSRPTKVLLLPLFLEMTLSPENAKSELLGALENIQKQPKEMTKNTKRAYVLLCSHKTVDKRCAITSKILKKEFDAQLREKEIHDVEVAFVSHVGGHKFAANALIYLSTGESVWLARVGPEHVCAIIEEVILKGKVFPELVRSVTKCQLDW